MIRPLPSKLVKSQKRVIGPIDIPESEGFGIGRVLKIEVRWDDSCGNGHNSFAVTGTIERKGNRGGDCDACGCLHEEIKKYGPPEVSKLIRWHLVGGDGPMHYKANTEFWLLNAERGGLWSWDGKRLEQTAEKCRQFARDTACLRDDEEFPKYDGEKPGTWRYDLDKFLDDRMLGLMIEFRKDVEEFGFTY